MIFIKKYLLYVLTAFIILTVVTGCEKLPIKNRDCSEVNSLTADISIKDVMTASISWNRTGITAVVKSPEAMEGLKIEIAAEKNVTDFHGFVLEDNRIKQTAVIQGIKDRLDGMELGIMPFETGENNILTQTIDGMTVYYDNCIMEYDEV